MVGILIWHCTGYVSVKVTNQCFNGSYERCPGFTCALSFILFVKCWKTNLFASCETMAQKVSFEWSHHRILCTDSKVRTTSVPRLPCRLWEEIAAHSTNFLYYVRLGEFRKGKVVTFLWSFCSHLYSSWISRRSWKFSSSCKQTSHCIELLFKKDFW